MWRILSIVRRNLHTMRKSSRVADEGAFHGAQDGHIFVRDGANAPGGAPGISVLCGVLVRAPLSIISACFVHPSVSNGGTDGAWASGDFAGGASEMNHLMVSDSIRYALLM